MTKDQIIREIRRTAEANGGVALGRGRFLAETGIRESDWHGKYWVRWGEAVREAGYSPNELNRAFEREEILSKLAGFVAELGHYPVAGELKLRHRSDPDFPDSRTFGRLGSRAALVSALSEFAAKNGQLAVVRICDSVLQHRVPKSDAPNERSAGFVYLIQHGSRRHFKIGRTNNAIRREGELAGAVPEKLKPVHTIETDDPAGIEAYWHRRFAPQRLQNEWFERTPADVRAFRRWRKIY